MINAEEIFKKKVYRHTKRIIGFIDIDQDSKSFGCADRSYWHYKLNDYSNARMQEVCFILAFCYQDELSEFYQNKKLLNLIKGIIEFWISDRNLNGSVNEIFPHEQSFCATSFSAFVVTETIQLLSLDDRKEKFRKELIKTGRWLVRNGNWHIANQISASVLALHNIGKMYDEQNFIDEAQKRKDYLLKIHADKGYFSEYGGFDLGYNTITMSLLALYFQKTQDRSVFKSLKQAEKKTKEHLDNYARYDNINMSRNTEFIYPFAFKVLKSPLLDQIKNGLEKDKILNPDWLDDRYLLGLSNDYLMTCFY